MKKELIVYEHPYGESFLYSDHNVSKHALPTIGKILILKIKKTDKVYYLPAICIRNLKDNCDVKVLSSYDASKLDGGISFFRYYYRSVGHYKTNPDSTITYMFEYEYMNEIRNGNIDPFEYPNNT